MDELHFEQQDIEEYYENEECNNEHPLLETFQRQSILNKMVFVLELPIHVLLRLVPKTTIFSQYGFKADNGSTR